MRSISEGQKIQIISLLHEGKLSREEIAKKAGVTPQTVGVIQSHMTMGTYSGSSQNIKKRHVNS